MRLDVREVVLDCPAGHHRELLAVIERLTGLAGETDNDTNPLVENPGGVDLGVQVVEGYRLATPLPAQLLLSAQHADVVTDPASGQQIVVVADPGQGGKPDPQPARVAGVRLRCTDAAGLAAFWARALGGGVTGTTVHLHGFDIVCEADASYVPPTWPSQEVGQTLHLDLATDDLDAAVAHVLEAGARLAFDARPYGGGFTLLDTAGHPFCIGTP